MSSVSLNAQVEAKLKQEAEEILSKLGISVSHAISMFYEQIIQEKYTTPIVHIYYLCEELKLCLKVHY